MTSYNNNSNNIECVLEPATSSPLLNVPDKSIIDKQNLETILEISNQNNMNDVGIEEENDEKKVNHIKTLEKEKPSELLVNSLTDPISMITNSASTSTTFLAPKTVNKKIIVRSTSTPVNPDLIAEELKHINQNTFNLTSSCYVSSINSSSDSDVSPHQE